MGIPPGWSRSWPCDDFVNALAGGGEDAMGHVMFDPSEVPLNVVQLRTGAVDKRVEWPLAFHTSLHLRISDAGVLDQSPEFSKSDLCPLPYLGSRMA